MVLSPVPAKHRIRQRVVLIAGFLVLGCGAVQMYPGPALPPDRVAVLEIRNVVLLTFDGEPVALGHKKSLQILPGEHDLRASHNMTGYPEMAITYTFTADPEHTYIFDADYEIKRSLSWRPWIKDSATGNIVGGWK